MSRPTRNRRYVIRKKPSKVCICGRFKVGDKLDYGSIVKCRNCHGIMTLWRLRESMHISAMMTGTGLMLQSSRSVRLVRPQDVRLDVATIGAQDWKERRPPGCYWWMNLQ